jgi:hypothetical protein
MADEVWDAPNQQVVRADQSGPGIDSGSGNGGNGGGDQDAEPLTLDEMTKNQLLEYAQSHGITPANAAMSKDEIRASIDAAEAAG